MKSLSSAHNTSQPFLNSQRYHLHGGVFRASNPMGWLKFDRIWSSSIYSSHCYSTSCKLQNGNKIENNVDLEIISRETVKPTSPTPHHLRTFNLSIIDQIMYDVYTPFILFFPNTNKASVEDVVTQRSNHLKETLSEILTRFYPFAGKIKNSMQIECNDEGIYYTETRVKQTLVDFLGHPDDERLRGLMPERPCTAESSIGNYVIGIQVNIFKCGGIGLSLSASHKIFDGQTFYIFLKAWAAAARGSSEAISPSFVASKIFPNNPSLEYTLSSKALTTKTLSTKRFVFDSTALGLLKAQQVANASSAHPPTRVEATTAVIWKAAAHAASKVRPFGPQSPHALLEVVNIRRKASPHLPEESIGNLIDIAGAICFPGSHLDLQTLMGKLRGSIAKKNSDIIESLKSEKGHETLDETVRQFNQLMDVIGEGDFIFASSLLNCRIYDIDFGWGKPIWFYLMNAGFGRFLFLNETVKGGGVEASVTLSSEEMEIFERDSELMSYATVNPSPLRFVQ